VTKLIDDGCQAGILVLISNLETSLSPTYIAKCAGQQENRSHLTIKGDRVHEEGSIAIKLRDLYESDMELFRAIG